MTSEVCQKLSAHLLNLKGEHSTATRCHKLRRVDQEFPLGFFKFPEVRKQPLIRKYVVNEIFCIGVMQGLAIIKGHVSKPLGLVETNQCPTHLVITRNFPCS